MATGSMDPTFVGEVMVFYDPTCLEVHGGLLDDFFIIFTQIFEAAPLFQPLPYFKMDHSHCLPLRLFS